MDDDLEHVTPRTTGKHGGQRAVANAVLRGKTAKRASGCALCTDRPDTLLREFRIGVSRAAAMTISRDRVAHVFGVVGHSQMRGVAAWRVIAGVQHMIAVGERDAACDDDSYAMRLQRDRPVSAHSEHAVPVGVRRAEPRPACTRAAGSIHARQEEFDLFWRQLRERKERSVHQENCSHG